MGLIPSFTLTQNQEVIVAIIAVAYALCAVVIQRKLSNAKRLRDIQAHISTVTKEMNAMIKAKASDAEIAAKQKEIMPLLGESMRSSMKPMFVILPMFLIMYYVIIPRLPLANATPKSIQGFFFIVVFIVGIITAIAMMIYDKQQVKKEAKDLDKESPEQIKTEIEALETKRPATDK